MFLNWLPVAVLLGVVAQSENLQERYRRWIDEEVLYLITESEKNKYLELKTNEERDRFIANFWYIRDPIKETVANEFQEEHLRRIRDTERLFRESAREAWMTDRGRMYITLGPANDVMRYPSPRDLYPLEVWSYYNLDIPGLPSALNLIFFKRRGVGEYRLYSPVFDGLPALIAAHQLLNQLGYNPYQPIPPQLMNQIEPDILAASQSIGPGFSKYTSEMVLADLNRPGVVHERLVKRLEGEVTADVTFTTQMNASFSYHAFQGEYGFTEVHLAVEVPPGDLSFTKYDDAYRGRVDISASVQDIEGNVVDEFQDAAEFSFSQEAFESAQHFPFLYQRKVLLLPGRYQMDLLLRNLASRRWGILHQTIQVAPFQPDQTTASSLLLAYKVDEATPSAGERLPYRFGSAQYYPMVDQTLGVGQPVYAFINLSLPPGTSDGLVGINAHYRLHNKEGVALENKHTYRRNPFAGDQTIPILIPISTEGLEPGAYTLDVDLHDSEGALVDELQTELQLKPDPVGLGRLVAEGEIASSHSERHLELGIKYFYGGNLEAASRRLRAALDFDPRSVTAKLYLGRSKALLGQYDEAMDLLKQVAQEDPTNAEAHASLGYCFFQLERFGESAASYREAVRLSSDQTDLLNALGQSELRAGNREKAMEAFSRSLHLSPEQSEVQQILKQIQEESVKNP